MPVFHVSFTKYIDAHVIAETHEEAVQAARKAAEKDLPEWDVPHDWEVEVEHCSRSLENADCGVAEGEIWTLDDYKRKKGYPA